MDFDEVAEIARSPQALTPEQCDQLAPTFAHTYDLPLCSASLGDHLRIEAPTPPRFVKDATPYRGMPRAFSRVLCCPNCWSVRAWFDKKDAQGDLWFGGGDDLAKPCKACGSLAKTVEKVGRYRYASDWFWWADHWELAP